MPGTRRLLLLTEDPALAAFLPAQLAQGTEFRAEPLTPAEGAARLASLATRHDATLLDAEAPPGAAHWAPRLAAAGGGRPVLLLGPAPAGAEGLVGVGKPVRLAELVPRLRAELARFETSPDAAIPLAGVAFHPAGKRLEGGAGERIRLTEKEAAILLYLHRAAGRPVPREELLGEVWGYSRGVTTHTLETHIYRLRRKIEAAARGPRIVTTEGGSYRLDAASSAA